MKHFYIITVLYLLIVFAGESYCQGPGEPFNPVIAQGAENVYQSGQILKWKNPSEATYNEVYISPYLSLVQNLDPSVRILNGYPGTVYTQLNLNLIQPLLFEARYYWRIVEHNGSGITEGPVWYFQTLGNLALVNIFSDNFDNYIPGQRLACQNPGDWTTMNNAPCDPTEDPLITQEQFYSDSNSVHIVYQNDPVKLMGPYSNTGTYVISMMMYVPAGHTAYWNVLQYLYPNPPGFEVFWDADGTGYVNADIFNAVSFVYPLGNWFQTSLTVDLDFESAEFRIGNTLVYAWQWTLGGAGVNALSAINYYGIGTNSSFYIDDFSIRFGYVLSPPTPPTNIQVEGINDDQPEAELSWVPGNAWGSETGYSVYRKNGLPKDPGNYELITDALGTTAVSYTDTTIPGPGTYTYEVHMEPIGPTGAQVTAYVPEGVPVELVAFTGSYTDNAVSLNWITATEINNRGFELERQVLNRNSPKSKWEKIGFVAGYGTSSEPHSYTFRDKEVAAGKYSYRLKQVDFDGSYEYSKAVEVYINFPAEFSLRQNYPNPFNPATTIEFSIPAEMPVNLSIYNVLGEKIKVLKNELMQPGNYKVNFDASSLPSGIYIYKLRAENFIRSAKMILLK